VGWLQDDNPHIGYLSPNIMATITPRRN